VRGDQVMRSTTATPSKRYHGVPLSDDDDNGMGMGSTSSPRNENDQDNTAGFQNGTSASFSRKLGVTLSQYSRVTDSDLQQNDMSMQEENNENDDANTETNSLVLGDASSPSSLRMTDMTKRSGIFRQSTLSMKDDNDNDDDEYTKTISRTPSAGAASTASKTPTSVQYDTVAAISENVSPTGLLSRQGSRCGASSTVSSVDWDDDDTFDDDIANIRRYHLEYSIGNGVQTQNYQQRQQQTDMSTDDYPITECGINLLYDCLRCRIRQSLSNITYHWQSLRQAARQRRAARLLTMPSENIRYKIHVCIVSSFCDATDMGIALTASCLLIWILFGLLTHNASMTYWLVGISLFVIRVSARRCYQVCRSIISSNMSYRRQQRRQNQQQRGRLDSRQYLTSMDNDHFPQNDTFAITRENDSDPVPTSV
jgi:hypothetical protein